MSKLNAKIIKFLFLFSTVSSLALPLKGWQQQQQQEQQAHAELSQTNTQVGRPTSVVGPSTAQPIPQSIHQSTNQAAKKDQNGSVNQAASLEVAPERETAISKVGIYLFNATPRFPNWSSTQGSLFCQSMSDSLNLKSYLSATCLEQVAKDGTKGSQPFSGRVAGDLNFEQVADPLGSAYYIRRLADPQSEYDGFLVGRVAERSVDLYLLSAKTGRQIERWSFRNLRNLDAKNFDASRMQIVDTIVDTIVRSMPYKGYVLEKLPEQKVLINIGLRHGVRVGDELQGLEFVVRNPTWSSPQRILGELKVVELRGDSQCVARVSLPEVQIDRFAKVRVFVPDIAKTEARTRYNQNKWLVVGSELMSLRSTTADTRFDNKKYDFSYTPFLSAGMGRAPWYWHFLMGMASGATEEVIYVALSGTKEILTFGNDTRGAIVSLGAWGSRFFVNRTSSSSILESSTRLAPMADVRFQYVPRLMMKLYAGGELYYPVLASDQIVGLLPFSVGYGGYLGTRLDFSTHFGVELGLRYLNLTLPFSGRRGVVEVHQGAFGRLLFLF